MLIKPNMAWPPPGPNTMRPWWDSWAAWWGGDLAKLRTDTRATAPGGYWARRADKHDNERQVHLPLAADIASTSAELLFGDTPQLEFATTAQQDAWDVFADELGWGNCLLEGADRCSALGGVYLRPQWDKTLADRALFTTVRADEAIPTWRYGILVAVTFVTVLDADSSKTLRWLEHHESGQIRHELWLGNTTSVGRQVPLTEHEVTASLAAPANGGGTIDTRSIRPTGLLVDYVPNLPNPLVRQPFGRADIQGSETLLDGLDEVWDSWLRDIRLGKGRILLSKEMLSPTTAANSGGFFSGGGVFGRKTNAAKAFDVDAEAFMPLEMPGEDGGKPAPITEIQFAIRVDEHERSAAALVEQIVSRSGFSPQTFGLHVDGQLSGTAINRRERRSAVTRGRKRQYWKPAVTRSAETLMLINKAIFGQQGDVARPALSWPADAADPQETANTVELLSRAGAISTEIKVRMAHPEWDDTQVEDEVKRIRAERPVAPDLTGFEALTPREQNRTEQEDEQQ